MLQLGNLTFTEQSVTQESLAIIGARFSGKTYTAQQLLPQLKSQVVTLDPEGQYPGQQKQQPSSASEARWLAEYAIKHKINVRLDHSRTSPQKAQGQTAAFLAKYYRLHRTPRKSIILVDEAYYYAPERGIPTLKNPKRLNGTAEYWLYTIQSRGRNRGIGAIIITQRPAQTSKAILGQCGKYLIFKLNLPNDRRWLRDFGLDRRFIDLISGFSQGQCLAVGFNGEPRQVNI